MLMSDRRDLSDRLDGADLIVRVHNADQKCVRDRLADVVGIDEAGPVDPHIGDLGTQALQKAAGLECGRMLDLGVITCDGRSQHPKNRPLSARLFASLPPLVNTTSSEAQPRSALTLPRAFSKAAFAGTLAQ
jgi:hypothetical protein